MLTLKRSMGALLASLMMTGLILGTGCGEDEICERPDEAAEIVGDDIIERLEQEADFPFHCGDSPPEFEGSFGFFDIEVVYTDSENWPASSQFCDIITTYEPTSNDFVYDVASDSPNCDTTRESEDNFISGKGDCFTLYSQNTSSFQGCDTEAVSVRSACLDEDEDLVDVIRGSYRTHVADSEECADVVENGNIIDAGELSSTKPAGGVGPKQE